MATRSISFISCFRLYHLTVIITESRTSAEPHLTQLYSHLPNNLDCGATKHPIANERLISKGPTAHCEAASSFCVQQSLAVLGALRPHSCFLYFQKARIGETKPRPARRRIDSTPSSTSTSLSLPRLVLAGTGFSRLSFTSPFFDPASRQDPRCNFCISYFIRPISVACSNFHYDSPTPSRH